jgi:hypothetical protein
MSEEAVRTLLDEGIPEPPAELLAAPLPAIRRRVRRRRTTLVLVTAPLAVVVALGVGLIVPGSGPGPLRPAAPPSPPMASWASGWGLVEVGLDERDLVVVRQPKGAEQPCADQPSVNISMRDDRIVLSPPVPPPDATCYYFVPVRLDAPLGNRLVVDEAGFAWPVFRARSLPRMTYPVTAVLDESLGHLPGAADRPSWVDVYSHTPGYDVYVGATLIDSPVGVPQAWLTRHGRPVRLFEMPPRQTDGRAVQWLEWDDGGWRFCVTLSAAEPVSRAELQRILDGLVWP